VIRALIVFSLAGLAVSVIGVGALGASGMLALLAALPPIGLFTGPDPFPDGTGLAFALVLSLWRSVLVPPVRLTGRALDRSGPARARQVLVAFAPGSAARAVGLPAIMRPPCR
jgi:hypothetical protein